jgi:hypothetical protein
MGWLLSSACRILTVAGTVLVFNGAEAADESGAAPPSDPGYRLGERLAAPRARQAVDGYEVVTWEALLPNDWNPDKLLQQLKLEELQDNDPRAKEVMLRITEMWKAAPANRELDQRPVRIAGFVVPLEGDRTALREFLLVPYFGACLHLPPPPANQIIHVVVPKTARRIASTNAAWISGILQVQRGDTRMAATSYRMVADVVEPFKREWAPF